MSAEITKVYKQDIPALRFIGKKYGDGDRVDGRFGKVWGDWFQNDWFDLIVKQTDKDLKTLYEDGDACIGLMRVKKGEPFEYWIGVFMPAGTQAPEGFEYRDFPEATLGVCWLCGNEGEVYGQEEQCMKRLESEGYNMLKDYKDGFWMFERYGCPRFTTPDKNGKIILDICFIMNYNGEKI